MREWLVRIVDWFHRDRLDAELAEELRFHQAHSERDQRAAGIPDREAARAARRRLGNVESVRLGYDADSVLVVGPFMRGVELDSVKTVALSPRWARASCAAVV